MTDRDASPFHFGLAVAGLFALFGIFAYLLGIVSSPFAHFAPVGFVVGYVLGSVVRFCERREAKQLRREERRLRDEQRARVFEAGRPAGMWKE